jgi:hypothetical protein
MKQFELLLGLYLRPLRTMARILDEGSPLFGAFAVLFVSAVFQFAPLVALGRAAAEPTPAASSSDSAIHVEDEDADVAHPLSALAPLVMGGPIATVVGMAVLFAPSLLLAATFLAPIGGFGVAFRRDFGGLLTVIFFVWTATHLPFVFLIPVLPNPFLLGAASALVYAAVLTPAVQLALGSSLTASAGAVIAGFFGLLLTPFLHFLASPFLLFYAWAFVSGNFSDVEWSLKARRNLRRYLEAATINPRDAEAHIQLGLIHLRRRQWPEARMRFERASEIDPTDPDARFHLGRIERREGHYPAAEKHFLAVIAKDPKYSHHEIWREFGANYLDAKLFDDARQALERFASLRAHDPEGLVYLGEALNALGRPDEAQARFKDAIEAADTMPHYRRHEVAEWRKRAKKALRR